MRNVFLSVVVICALLVAAIGGTLAGFSDTERSTENYFEVGNMDLKVSVGEIEYDDPDVPAIVDAGLAWPCESQDFGFDLHNVSDNTTEVGYAYMRIKDFECYEVFTAKFPEPDRPEPEDVAENGGCLANKEIEGLGPWGQNCTLADFVEIMLTYEGEIILGNNTPWGGEGTVYLSDMVPEGWDPETGDPDDILWIYLGEIPGCHTTYGDIALHISNWSEEEWNERFDTDLNYFNDDLPFNDWLTNLFQNDGVEFTIEFALTQDPIPADYLIND
jgi:predicted ribosomally synthesized peptide with SipW-like signal peptide